MTHMPDIDRRSLMLGGAALAALPLARLSAQQPPSPLDAVADRLLPLFPETATYNGVPGATDGGPLARRMDDWSPAGETARRDALAAEARRLAAVRIGDPVLARQAAIVSALLDNGVRSAGVSYGRINPFWFSGHVPYLITPVAGPHIDTVNLLDSQQPVNNAAAADAWISRLDDFGRGFDGVIAKLKADEAAGCRPPRVLLEKSLPVIDRFLAGPAKQHALIVSLDKRMTEAGLSPRVRAAALGGRGPRWTGVRGPDSAACARRSPIWWYADAPRMGCGRNRTARRFMPPMSAHWGIPACRPPRCTSWGWTRSGGSPRRWRFCSRRAV